MRRLQAAHDLARIAQLVAYPLGTKEVPGSNPGNGKNFSVKIKTIEGRQKDTPLEVPT